VGLFLDEDCPKLLSELHEAVLRRDSQMLERAAHALKGMVGEFCAKPAFEAALRLQMIGYNGDLSRVDDAYVGFKKEIEQLRQVLIKLASD
jgi:hypothetical protein